MVSRFERIEEELMKVAAEFFSRESNRSSLITVTSVKLSHDAKKGLILITVFPESSENAALLFAKRQLSDLRAYVTTDVKMRRLPFLDIAIDLGEKNRQRIDEISNDVSA